jgi:outer membrane protein OmpA-like peptidoglycan-associated protein
MKTWYLCAALMGSSLMTFAQSTSDILKQQAGQGVKEGATVVTEQAGQKATDKVLGKLFGKKNKKTMIDTTVRATGGQATAGQSSSGQGSAGQTSTGQGGPTSAGQSSNGGASLQTYSKFDFIPGDKVLAIDDFGKDEIGDYPANWNTNASAETVNSTAGTGHWLMFTKQGKFFPEYINNLPDNFTLEYDLAANDKFSYYGPFFSVYLVTGKTNKEVFGNGFMVEGRRSGIKLGIHPNAGNNIGVGSMESFEDGQSAMKNQVNTGQFSDRDGKGFRRVHVSIWRQKQRVRMYLNEEKVFDLSRALPAGKAYDAVLFEISSDMKADDRYLLGNIKLAAGAPDTRNRLITEGKFSTTGILFDVNSAAIRPESYGSLKDIADVLTENAAIKVKIVGHTDSDGDAGLNLTLSKKRAEAVKDAFVKTFGIDASRITTDGQGAGQPLASNSTSEGKAQNRRVEFVKM